MNDGLLISGLNGRPLVRNHGAPWRALFPGWYGDDSVKWLERISLAPAPLPPVGQTYMEVWQAPSGSIETKPLPRVQVNSVIISPVDGAVLHSGKLQLKGVAWSGAERFVTFRQAPTGENFGARPRSKATRVSTIGPYGTPSWKSRSEDRSNLFPRQRMPAEIPSRPCGTHDEWILTATMFGTACVAWWCKSCRGAPTRAGRIAQSAALRFNAGDGYESPRCIGAQSSVLQI